MNLRPFFTYYGGKFRAAPKYPEPRYATIIEPFAGSAGYALRYPDRQVVLVERDPKIAAVWRYLLSTTPESVRDLPLWGDGWRTTDDLNHLDDGARYLIALWCNKGSATPHKTPSKWMRDGTSRPEGENYWGAGARERIARQVDAIRHWTLIEGDFHESPHVDATWFIDPPYVQGGHRYPSSNKLIDYAELGTWCQTRPGQTIVCESEGADWLPFSPFATIKATEGRLRSGTSAEVVWLGENCPECGAAHDVRPCALTDSLCDCCEAIEGAAA